MESTDESFLRLGEVIVPDFADWFAVHLDEGSGDLTSVSVGDDVSASRTQRQAPGAGTGAYANGTLLELGTFTPTAKHSSARLWQRAELWCPRTWRPAALNRDASSGPSPP